MKTPLYNQKAEKAGTYDLPDRVFKVPFNADVVHQTLVAHRANARAVLAHTKGRGDVRGGGKKPWAQKGTGRARHGSTRSPIWKGGGVTFGPKNTRIFTLKINKKQKQKALSMILSSKVRDRELAVIDAISMKEPKTKIMAEIIRTFLSSVFEAPLHKKVLVIVPKADRNVTLAIRNLPHAKVISADSLNAYDLMSYAFVVMSKDAIEIIERTYTKVK
ncbi:50S ribosomal protein L4 [Candidatus Azambacteria bacterium]|nr:50S ribosomal protein L4 [Candidatus Azambacteria bacterium]